MSERIPTPDVVLSRQKIRRALGIVGAGIALGVPAALGVFTHNSEQVEIAATKVEVTPTFDGYITARNGWLPDVRKPQPLPFSLGVNLDVGNPAIPPSDTAGKNIGNIARIYGSVAAQPSGEVKKIHDVVIDQALTAGIAGLAVGMLPLGTYVLLGKHRRKELSETRLPAISMGLVGAVLLSSTVSASTQQISPPANTDAWTPLTVLVPESAKYDELSGIEVSKNAASGAMRELVNGAIDSYVQSTELYDSFKERVEAIRNQLHQPREGEKVAIVVSDRHDNIGMDPVHRALADVAGATILIDAGDDTSSGQEWEEFSLRSLNSQFPSSQFVRIAISGNHDSGGMVEEYWKHRGAHTSSDTVQEIEGIQTILIDDPRQSDYTGDVVDGEATYAETSDMVTSIACESDKRIGLVVVHSASMAHSVLEQGCADLVVGGHLHRAIPPTKVEGQNGMNGYTVTNASSGGAVYSFSAFGGLRRDAGDTLITFRDGRPVGVQQVTFATTGEVTVSQYYELSLDETPDYDAAPEKRDNKASQVSIRK